MGAEKKWIRKLNKINLTKASFVVLLVYISLLNLFIIRTTPEIILLQFTFLLLIFNKSRSKNFIKAWLPFIALFFVYEFLRGIADDLSPFYSNTLYVIYNVERNIFRELPNILLQNSFLNNIAIINLSLLFYLSFFYYSFLVAFIIWMKTNRLFYLYIKQFLIISGVGLLMFFVFPTAPPWFVADQLDIGVTRLTFQNTILTNYSELTLYKHFVYGNPVAAMPSLHTAWPAFTSLFLIKNFKNKALYLSLIIPVMISFAVILFGEHFLLDVVAGWLLSIAILKISSKSIRINKTKSLK